MGEDWSLLFSFMRKSIRSWEGLEWTMIGNRWSMAAPSHLDVCLAPSPVQPRGPFKEGCQPSQKQCCSYGPISELIRWRTVWLSIAGRLYLMVEICCCEHSNPILQCSVTLWKCRFKHMTPLYFRAFLLPWEKILDWIFPFFVLSTSIYKYNSVILHEFLLLVLSKA